MDDMATKFEYADSLQSESDQEEFVLVVPPGIRSKGDLLAAIAGGGQFPGYFGYNWDALQDCLRDLSWIDTKRVAILHSDIPLREDSCQCRTYLEVLQTALADWVQVIQPDTIEPLPDWPFVEHELRVIFPNNARASIARLLGEEC